MKILFDECMNADLAPLLPGHEIKTVTQSGWSGIKNGELLRRANGNFDVFITVDQNLAYQQNIKQFKMVFLIIRLRATTAQNLQAIAYRVIEQLGTVMPGELYWIE